MSKRQLIEYIRELNPTAREDFLEPFTEDELRQYLDQLRGARDHRIHIRRWSRRDPESRIAS